MSSSDGSVDPTLTPSQVSSALSETAIAGDTVPDGPTGTARSIPTGYKLGKLLGRGGMGEVLLAEDIRIGRKVAVKRMRADLPTREAIDRFEREAKIQARLDHPAIVPVHELGIDREGRPYFTMKRLTGVTLAEVLSDRNESQQKLLRAFVDVCHAIEFAHANNVIHRDLKPANVMLGDYAEVYVLDWGVARVIGDLEPDTAGGDDTLAGHTQVGAVLGTPGYMSPEQVRGDEVGTATDVYALGSILFEILAGEPAHPRGQAALTSTLEGCVASPAKRTPDRAIAPELDAVCTEALADVARSRPSARELADRIQRYLDGDRDLERRRALATEQLDIARTASTDPARRSDAMRAAGRALALDPESTAAAQLVSQLMLEPPAQTPPQLEQRLDQTDLDLVGTQSRNAWRAMLSYLLLVPTALWLGVRDWPIVITTFILVAVITGGAVVMERSRRVPIYWALVLQCAMLVLLARWVSPFVLVPGLIAASATSLIVFPTLMPRPWLVIGTFIVAFLLPFALEATGVWSSTWEMVGDRLVLRSGALEMSNATSVLLIISHLALIIVMPLFVRSLAASQRTGRRQLEVHAWHLNQLLPVDAPRAAPTTEPRCEILR